jgi:hypothetical protein
VEGQFVRPLPRRSRAGHLVSSIKYRVSSIKHRVSSIKYRESSIEYRVNIPNRLDQILVLPLLLYRLLRYRSAYRLVPLTQGLYAKVDPDMFYIVSQYKWYARKSAQTYYATTTQYRNGRRSDIHMHRLIMQLKPSPPPSAVTSIFGIFTRHSFSDGGLHSSFDIRFLSPKPSTLPPDSFVDHINGDGFDNRRCNLRLATSTQNNYNRRITSRRTSKYKGVDYRPSKKAYRARITVNKQKIFLGYFPDETSAAKAYDLAAKKYHKEFAVLNFPDV